MKWTIRNEQLEMNLLYSSTVIMGQEGVRGAILHWQKNNEEGKKALEHVDGYEILSKLRSY